MAFLKSKNMIHKADWGRERHDVDRPFTSLTSKFGPNAARQYAEAYSRQQHQQHPVTSPSSQSLPASARGHAGSSLPLQSRITLTIPPSTPLYAPVLPLSPRTLSPRTASSQAARGPHPPPPLIPRPLMSATQVRIATAALIDAHPPRPVTAILANVPLAAPTPLLEHLHPSTFVPVPPSPRPGSHRVRAAREVPCAELEQIMQAHYKHAMPPMMPGASSASVGAPRPASPVGEGIRNEMAPNGTPRAFTGARPATRADRLSPPGLSAEEPLAIHRSHSQEPLAEEPPARPVPYVTVSHEEVWGHFQMEIWRRLTGPAEPPPRPPKKKPVRKKLPRKKAEVEEVAVEDLSWEFRIPRLLQQMAAKNHLKMMDVFKKFDSDGSGAIDQFEFEAALVELGLHDVPRFEARKVFESYDADSSGSLDMDELATMIKAGRGPSQLGAKLQVGAVTGYTKADHKATFTRAGHMQMEGALARLKAIDTDGDGSASIKEVLAFLLAEGYSAAAVDELMKIIDKDGDGTLTEDEWKTGVSKLAATLGASPLLALTEPVDAPNSDLFVDALHPTWVGPDGKVPYRSSRSAMAQAITVAPEGCTIQDQTMRGIQLQQLRSLIVHLKRRCKSEGWVTTDEEVNAELGLETGASTPLEWDRCSMYDVLAYVVKPATRARRCSFVELVAKDAQRPEWYVVHRWGEPLVDTLTCLERHAKDRNLDLNTTTYWVSALAMSPWDVSEHLAADPFSSPFFRALEATKGCVVVVDRDRSKQSLDTNAPYKGAKAFSRLWVCFEIAVALQRAAEKGYIFDMYTARSHNITGNLVYPAFGLDEPPLFIVHPKGDGYEKRQAVGMTDPSAPLELPVSTRDYKHYESEEQRDYRQTFFPSNALIAGLSSKLQKAEATIDADRKHILNALVNLYTQSQARVAGAVAAGAWHLKRTASLLDVRSISITMEALSAEPPAEHEGYDVYNGLLQAKLAAEALQRAFREGESTLEKVIKEVRTAPLTVLRVSMRDAKNTAQFEEALKCLPETLRILELELPDVLYKVKPKKRDEADASSWDNVKVFPDMTHLKLRQRALSDEETEKLSQLARHLQSPEMVIGRLVGYAHESALFRAEQLETVDLQGWPTLEEIPWNLFEMTSLRTLNVSDCKRLSRIKVQFPLIPSQLESLSLDGCSALTELEEGFSRKLSNLTGLSLRGCTSLGKLPIWVNDIERKGAGVVRPAHLK